MDKKKIRGLSAEQIKKIAKNSINNVVNNIVKTPQKIINSRSRIKKIPIPEIIPGVIKRIIRPKNNFLTTLAKKVTRLPLPERGSFNAGMVKFPHKNEYVLAYRPDEYRFITCVLDEKLNIKKDTYKMYHITNCADPRLMWTPNNELLMVYSSCEEGTNFECIRGCIIMDLNKSEEFLDTPPFRISPKSTIRNKNWMPFVHDKKIYLIGTVCPHTIYELKFEKEPVCKQVYETSWISPWMFKEFLRGNTNPVRLDDGNYLSTFHTATWYQGRCFYDNGAYIFEGKPPFKVLKCANRTYLKAEDAVEPHFRKGGLIACTFPVGMVKEDDRLLISYGDNDSCVKIMETSVKEMTDLMLEVY